MNFLTLESKVRLVSLSFPQQKQKKINKFNHSDIILTFFMLKIRFFSFFYHFLYVNLKNTTCAQD